MKGLNHLIENTNAIYLTTDDGSRHNGDQTIAEIEAEEEEEAATAVDADGSIDKNEEVISTSSTPQRHQIVICTSFEQASRAMIELIALGANFAPTTTTSTTVAPSA